jgi:hypothetical protein
LTGAPYIASVFAALTLAALATPAIAKSKERAIGGFTTPGIEILDHGLYATSHERVEKAPDQIAGEREIVSNVRLIRKTRKFSAQLGRTFGFRYRVRDPALAGATLTFRLKFPRLTNPATGQSRRFQDVPQTVNLGVTRFEAYGFDHRWEIAEGIWTMQIRYKGKVLAEQRFLVLVPLN